MDISKIAKLLGKRGGDKSVKNRFEGKTKAEVSEMMRKIRYSKADLKEMGEQDKEFVKGLNDGAGKN